MLSNVSFFLLKQQQSRLARRSRQQNFLGWARLRPAATRKYRKGLLLGFAAHACTQALNRASHMHTSAKSRCADTALQVVGFSCCERASRTDPVRNQRALLFLGLHPNRSMAAQKKLQGVVAATVTPMTPDGEINLSVIGQYVDYLISEQGVKNVFVNGTTGEGLSLSVQERKQLAEEWVTKGKDKLDYVIIHVGALSLPEAKGLAKHAAEIGADGIAVIAPSFFKQVKKDALVAFLRGVASEAPGIPFYYYHIPPLTGIKITAYELLNGMIEQIPTFKGVKFSDKDLLDFGQCVKKNDRGQFVLLYGVDEQLLAALAMGATGAVGSTYNYLGKANNSMLEAFAKGDLSLAQKYQCSTQEVISFFIAQGFGVAETKAIVTLLSGIPMGPPRLPLSSASEEFIANVKPKLESLKNCCYS
ncbi:N-acetylneuraminate lyase isoform X2 [Podarcis raffonei]|uniref:N-acetylneuraminate lyase isoform X2 n=2 Tax=Podarcis raffonei TaxID=65483 RepID=UPI0023295701|nr:N-acetylneuraminate lyase isoform X2 [Podarcis raffonei]